MNPYRCKNCQYWTAIPNQSDGICSKGFMTEHVWIDDLYPDKAGVEIDGAGTYDGVRIAQFWTGPEFGCVHFAQRTEDE